MEDAADNRAEVLALCGVGDESSPVKDSMPSPLRTVVEEERAHLNRDSYYAIVQACQEAKEDASLLQTLIAFAASTMSLRAVTLEAVGHKLDVDWSRVNSLEELELFDSQFQGVLDEMVAEGKQLGHEEGRAQERRESLQVLASPYLKPGDATRLQTALDKQAVAQLPAITDMTRIMEDAADNRAEVLAICGVEPDPGKV